MFRMYCYVDNQEEAATVSYHSAHPNNSFRGQWKRDLDGEKCVGKAGGCRFRSLRRKAGGVSEREIGLYGRASVDDCVALHPLRLVFVKPRQPYEGSDPERQSLRLGW